MTQSPRISNLLPAIEGSHRLLLLTDNGVNTNVIRKISKDLPRDVSFESLTLNDFTDLDALASVAVGGADSSSHVTMLLVTRDPSNAAKVRHVYEELGDNCSLGKLDVPMADGDTAAEIEFLVDVLRSADYIEQERYSATFFRCLESSLPYTVKILTQLESELTVRGEQAWFDLSGRLQRGESRLLPGGEVAFTGDDINGSFSIDGCVLPTPQTKDAVPLAEAILQVAPLLPTYPLTLHVVRGVVESITATGKVKRIFEDLLEDPHYRNVTEVGISFNRACRFTYGWASPSNEGRPGVHLALGGDADPNDAAASRAANLVHIDLMAATTEVSVNGSLFMATHASEGELGA